MSAQVISRVLKEGVEFSKGKLNVSECRSILTQVKNIIRLKRTKPRDSLSDWFLKIPWLRSEMEIAGFEKTYLKLESPKMLKASFQTGYCCVLGEFFRLRAVCRETQFPTAREIIEDQKVQNYPEKSTSSVRLKAAEQTAWFSPSLASILENNSLKEVFFTTRYGSHAQPAIAIHKQKMLTKLKPRINSGWNGGSEIVFCSPSIFGCSNLIIPSKTEQFLVMELLSTLGIQPDSVGRLKLQNILIGKNLGGGRKSIQIKYCKPRSGYQWKESPVVSAHSVLGRVLLEFVDLIEESQEYLDAEKKGFLFPSLVGVNTFRRMVNNNVRNGVTNSPRNMFYFLIKQPTIKELLHQAHKREKTSKVFMDALLFLIENYDSTKKNNLIGDKKEFPKSWWTNSHLKQLAVFARSDLYRVGDLVNFNSHTSERERISYLNEKNRDWVNRYGRIFRIVVKDLETNVFQPDISKVKQKSNERNLRTEVVSLLELDCSASDVLLNSINPLTLEVGQKVDAKDGNSIVVLDHPTTVLFLLHYLSQAKLHSRELALNAPDFLERTVAPMCEWMERLLIDSLCPKSVREGTKQYSKLSSFLPSLFDYKLRSLAL